MLRYKNLFTEATRLASQGVKYHRTSVRCAICIKKNRRSAQYVNCKI